MDFFILEFCRLAFSGAKEDFGGLVFAGKESGSLA